MRLPHARPGLTLCLAALWMALATLLICARPARAALPPPLSDPLPDPCTLPGSCLPPDLQTSPWLTLLAADGPLVYAHATAPGSVTPRLTILDARRGLAARGGIPLDAHFAVAQGEYLYTAAGSILTTVRVANPDHPVIVDRIDAGAPLGALYAQPGALYALSPRSVSTETTTTDLRIFTLADPARPHPQALRQEADWGSLALDGALLVSVGRETPARAGTAANEGTSGDDGATVSLLTLTPPLAPTRVATLRVAALFPPGIAPPYAVAATGGFAYVMAHDASGAPLCRVVDVRTPHTPEPGASCPFVAGQTAMAGAFAYVNPNASASEYLDYAIVALADPAAPRVIGSLPQRFAALHARDGRVYAQESQRRIVQYAQAADGSLTEQAASWTGDAARDDTIALVAGERLWMQGRTDAGAVLSVYDLAEPGALRPLGAITSPALSGARLLLHGTTLVSVRTSRIALFDAANPAVAQPLGRIDAPAGESIEHAIVGGDGRLYIATEHNTLLSVDIRRPLTPTVSAVLDLPGAPRHLLWVRGTIYLYEDNALSIVEASGGRLELLKRIDIGDDIEEATAYGPAVYLRIAGASALQILDASTPATPRPLPLTPAPAELVRMLPVAGGRLLLVYRQEEEAAPYTLVVHELRDPLAPRPVAVVAGLESAELWSDGDCVVLEGLHVLRIGERRATLAPLPAATPHLFQATPAISYAAPALPEGSCIRHTAIAPDALPTEPILAWYDGLYHVELVRCADGAPLAAGALTLRVVPATGARPAWRDPYIALDLGDRWAELPEAESPEAESSEAESPRALLLSPAQWALVGPPWPPVRLPLVQR